MHRRTTGAGPNPSGLCMCGCGEATPIARQSDSRCGHIKGQPIRYIRGHNTNPIVSEYIVDESTGCWVWQRYRNSDGYGRARDPISNHFRPAHRIYYERLVGPMPEGMQLDHLCRNRACVNPAHLEPVTPAENVRRGNVTKLTRQQVAEIRQLLGTKLQSEIAQLFGVTPYTIAHIAKGRTWVGEGLCAG